MDALAPTPMPTDNGSPIETSKPIGAAVNVQSDQPKSFILQNQSSSKHCTNCLYSVPNVSTNFIAGPDAVGFDGDIDGPTYQFDFDFDLDVLKKVLRNTDTLEESGYHSVLARSQHSNFGTGWLMFKTGSLDSVNSVDEWGK